MVFFYNIKLWLFFCLLVCGVIRKGKMVERRKKDKKIEKGDFLLKDVLFIYVYILLYMSCLYVYTCMQMLTEARSGIIFPGASVIGS